MFDSSPFGKVLITIGIIFIIIGALFYFGERFGIGRLPGDIYLKKVMLHSIFLLLLVF